MREPKLFLFLLNKEGPMRCSEGDGSQLPNMMSKGFEALRQRGFFCLFFFNVFFLSIFFFFFPL